ncbi:MAG: asparagine synthase (glutamine-hydrolyzing) [Flavobacteriaceae bacterium]|nr:asparagine synthase (glutamine-hydrolyzing) [Flavobacteriaceae bacterium]
MCGIYGSTLQYSDSQVREKLERTAFRGPDKMDFKTYQAGNTKLIFGHNRLAIIDLDHRSDQPFNYFNKVHIVFNGEIYNFQEIKQILTSRGYSFQTTSDTEVICAAYLEYGESCVDHFNGMFAFVIYDVENHRLFGARDRLGQKPFYYYHNGTEFEFASQISSIQLHHNALSISRQAIDSYLCWGLIPDPLSIFNEVKKLRPGHSFTYDLASGKFHDTCYWDIDFKGKTGFKGSYDEAQEALTVLLRDAVSMRLFADVPVGVFLSGGVDSSLVSAMATQTSSAKVKTFSVKFDEDGYDESPYAQQVADHLQTDHHVIACNYAEGMDLIDNFSTYYDEPFADSSAIPSMLLSKYTRKQVTVALSGDGGDESFIGYERYIWARKGGRMYVLPRPIRQLGSALLNLSPNYRHKMIGMALGLKNVDTAYLTGMTEIDGGWIDSEFDSRDIDQIRYLNHREKNFYERISDFDLKTYLNWDINTKVDRATMAYSLESRSPLMDFRVVELARSFPTEFKIKKGNTKRILKDVLYQSVPSHIFDRPKAGFTMPFAHWFRHELKDYVLDELNESGLGQIPGLKITEVSKRIDQHMTQSWNRYPLIWKLLVLKQWLNKNGTGLTVK